jgi:hypothetical protein
MDKPHFQENKLNAGDNSSNTPVKISNIDLQIPSSQKCLI